MTVNKIYFYLFIFLSLVSFLGSILLIIQDYSVVIEFHLFSLNSSSVIMAILTDWISLLFISFVLFISGMVIFYSEEYMSGDPYQVRFIFLVVMFVISMLLLIISPNLISILLGWDGLGLVSYCLVIYYQNPKSYNAGMLTALTNRIGDVALLISIAWLINYGSWSYIYYLEVLKSDYFMYLVMFMVVLAALTKSAQIPFSAWLPAAMAAPTPVSSLVHSSTLVTAGVYLLIRFSPCLPKNLMFILLFLGSMTMFMAGLGASFEFDLKKIIALSTLSQLGFMMGILALGDSHLAFFHLLVHAVFKALLFMCAGVFIHSLGGLQDIRFMGGLSICMPLTCSFFNICNLSLCGLPFFSGFYSKDLIVEVLTMNFFNIFIYIIFYFSIGLTVCYSFRLTYYSLSGDFNFLSLHSLGDTSLTMIKGMGGLIFFVVTSGSLLSWLIFPTPYYICLPFSLKLMTLVMITLGMWFGYSVSKFNLSYNLNTLSFLGLSTFLASMWNMPVVSTSGLNKYPIVAGEIYSSIFDQGWLENYGGRNLGLLLIFLSKTLQLFSLNHLKVYFSLILIWIVYLCVFIL
uniref:NADH-ubiquinone oxidoreductase chain 5 n=1 Tax=Bifidoprionus rufus TaxID=2546597 RepID=A0A6H0N5Y2_9CUCU|nr:NADH dehydrogenase subunit 5 [Bifidoprionus rufus]